MLTGIYYIYIYIYNKPIARYFNNTPNAFIISLLSLIVDCSFDHKIGTYTRT